MWVTTIGDRALVQIMAVASTGRTRGQLAWFCPILAGGYGTLRTVIASHAGNFPIQLLFSLSNPSLAADKELAPGRLLSTFSMLRIVAALARYLHACDWRNAGPQQTCTGHKHNIISQNLLAVRNHGSARKGYLSDRCS